MTATDATAATTAPTIPGYRAGTWVVDPSHSEVGFSVRHLMVSKVRGRFASFEGTFVTAENPLDSTVEASIDVSSVDTNNADRDAHLRSADFFDVEQYPDFTYRSTGIRVDDGDLVVDGELTLHGLTKPVPLALEVHGFLPESPFGDHRVGLSATGELSRKEFGITFDAPLEGGGVGLSDRIHITLEIEAVLQGDDA
ncbi:MAG: YceI family protein [Acidimicrobiia bacterium]